MSTAAQGPLNAFARGADRPDLRAQRVIRAIASGNATNRHFIEYGGDRFERDAAASAKRWSEGLPIGPMDGLLLAVKDNIDVQGFSTTAGSRLGATLPLAQDAPLVQRLREAGALMIGKVNMNEAALGVDGNNAVHGYCANPRWASHSSGGSSSGSAAAVAAGTADLALGTDTMGSVRIPAAFCGLVGYKPSAGHLSNQGVVPLCKALDVVGILGRTVQDVRRLLWVARPSRSSDRSLPLTSIRFGIPLALTGLTMDEPVERAWLALLERLRDAGLRLTPLPVANWEPGALRRAALLKSEKDAYEHWSRHPRAFSNEGLTLELQDMLRYPARAGAERIARATHTLDDAASAWTHALSQVDVVLMPTAPVDSFARQGVVPTTSADLTVPANVAGAPAISLPLGAEYPRVGVQLMASRHRDEYLMTVAQRLQMFLQNKEVQPA